MPKDYSCDSIYQSISDSKPRINKVPSLGVQDDEVIVVAYYKLNPGSNLFTTLKGEVSMVNVLATTNGLLHNADNDHVCVNEYSILG
ncbi:unnamed protein product [Schistosoma spindalis]|nr:unnamed protein product [Schistosoma spindale]